jgi:hypothetical protein
MGVRVGKDGDCDDSYISFFPYVSLESSRHTLPYQHFMHATFLMPVTKIPVLKLATFCETIAPWPVKYEPTFRRNLWHSALEYLENGSSRRFGGTRCPFFMAQEQLLGPIVQSV